MNYDVDYEADSIRNKSNLRLTIPLPEFFAGDLEGSLYSLHKDEKQAVPVRLSDGTIECTISELGMSAALVISSKI